MPAAVSSEAFKWENITWRVVEAQHVASAMKVVDTQQEQNILEELLEGNKPTLKIGTEPLDYLLATPFRYYPHRSGSRFRSVNDPGVYYGAESIATACAELGYWRWRFLKDAPELDHIDPVAHTLFKADISTVVVDLRKPPFDVDEPAWTHKTDYSATQEFAKVAREAAIGGIIYKSVRNPNPSWCIALLTPEGFARSRPHPATQTWWLNVNLTGVNWRRENESMAFRADTWAP
jgi:hypothetical protein